MSSVIRITVYGEKLDLADDLQEEFHDVAKEVVQHGSVMLLGSVQRKLRLRRGTPKTAAPEGEPPESDTDALASSWRLIPPRVKGNVVSAGIQSRDPGILRREYGETDARGIRTLPHPFLRPAIAETDGPIGRLFEERL